MSDPPVQFRLIHISDLHLCIEPRRRNALALQQRRPSDFIDAALNQTKRFGVSALFKPASYSPAALVAVAMFCLERRDYADAVIISGDVATTGLAVDLAVAKTFATAAPQSGIVTAEGTPTLNASGLPIYLMPGNHDGYSTNSATPGSKNFELLFALELARINFRNSVGHKVLTKGGKHLSLVYIDFSLRRRRDCKDPVIGPLGQGRVYPEVLNEAIDRTKRLRQHYGNTEVCWIVHFAPFECGYPLELTNRDLLRSAAENHHIRTILCGHTHDASRYDSVGVRTYCAGSAASIDKERHHSVHEIVFTFDGTWTANRLNFVWSEADAAFMPDDLD